MTKKRATEDLLGELHEAVARGLLDAIKSGDASPAVYNAAIKLLKDNKIEAVMEAGNTLDELYKHVPSFIEDDEDGDYVN